MYALIGKKLSYSYSKMIHEWLTGVEYEMKEIDDIISFISKKQFEGLNITNPFKHVVIDYLDYVDESVKKTNSCNTIVNKQGVLSGYNTDYYGFLDTLKHHKIDVKGKSCLIIGNGATMNTIKTVLTDLSAHVIVACRTKKQDNEVLLSDLSLYKDKIEIIINATPVGLSESDDLLINVSEFKNLQFVIDLIYNPYRTKLLIEAKKLGIKTVNGLYMLTTQAVYSEILFDRIKNDDMKDSLYKWVLNQTTNLVLIGMPTSGKSLIGKRMGEVFDKDFIDTDSEIEEKAKMKIKDIFSVYGEQYFRDLEESLIDDIKHKQKCLISTGGGMIKAKNFDRLLLNGIIIYIQKTDFSDFIDDKTRPLVSSSSDLFGLFQKRHPMYLQYSDIIVDDSNAIREKIDEYYSS